MKNKIFPLLICSLLFSACAFSQDTLHKSSADKKNIIHKNHMSKTAYHSSVHVKKPAKKPIYRDTRLGSSTKTYDTYKKNKNGAGAVTTDPK